MKKRVYSNQDKIYNNTMSSLEVSQTNSFEIVKELKLDTYLGTVLASPMLFTTNISSHDLIIEGVNYSCQSLTAWHPKRLWLIAMNSQAIFSMRTREMIVKDDSQDIKKLIQDGETSSLKGFAYAHELTHACQNNVGLLPATAEFKERISRTNKRFVAEEIKLFLQARTDEKIITESQAYLVQYCCTSKQENGRGGKAISIREVISDVVWEYLHEIKQQNSQYINRIRSAITDIEILTQTGYPHYEIARLISCALPNLRANREWDSKRQAYSFLRNEVNKNTQSQLGKLELLEKADQQRANRVQSLKEIFTK